MEIAQDQSEVSQDQSEESSINLTGHYKYYDPSTKKYHIVEAHETFTGYPTVIFLVFEGDVPSFAGAYENKDAFAEKVNGEMLANENYKYTWIINGVKGSSAGIYGESGNSLDVEVEREEQKNQIGIGVNTVCVEVVDKKERFIGKDCWTINVIEKESEYLLSPIFPDGDDK